jgi:predicted Zn-dependent peptidase
VKKTPPPRCESLENGVWVATESLPHVHSVSLGVYLDTGSRDETPLQNGLSHFFEHMVFKGTPRLGPLDIVRRFEATGGQVNAYTSKEQTCFYGKVVDSEAGRALDVLLDMVLAAKFDPADIEKEKEVVIEEIRSTHDSADDLVYDLFARACFGNHALGRPIAGTEKTVRTLSRAQLLNHREGARAHVPLAVVAVGCVEHEEVVAQVRKRFRLPTRKSVAHRHPPRPALAREAGNFRPGHLSKQKDVQQATVLLGGPAYSWASPQRYPLLLLHSMLGDGMGSKLFQNLREKHGLVYSIYSNPEFLSREGLFTIGFATEPKNLAKATKEIGRELAALRRKGLSAGELDFAKKSVKGGILLGMESTSARMATLARRLLGGDPQETLERILKRIEAVTRQDILLCAREVLHPDRWSSAAVVPHGVKAELAGLLAKA